MQTVIITRPAVKTPTRRKPAMSERIQEEWEANVHSSHSNHIMPMKMRSNWTHVQICAQKGGKA